MAPEIRLLYVDDEPTLLDIGKLFLEAGGDCRVDTLTSAKEALEQLDAIPYDAIISDYQMPEMDGIRFLVEVRTRFGQIPFILFTGRGREEIAIKALNAGADFYLQKGGDPKSQFVELIYKVRQAVRRNTAERALWENEVRYRTLFQNALDIIRILDRNGVITYDSLSSEKILGYPYGSLIGKNACDYIHPGDLPHVKRDLEQVYRKENPSVPTEFRIRKENGDYIWVESVAVNLLGVEGVDGIVVTTRPISERKRVEEILRKSETNLQRAEEIGGSGSWELRLNENVFEGSKGAGILYGMEGTRWIAEEIRKITLPEYHPLLDAALRDLIAGKSPYNMEFKIRRKSDGKILDIHSLAEYDPVQKIVFGVIHDISERKRAEEELLRKNTELSASYEQIAAAEEELRCNLDELSREECALRESEERFRKIFKNSPLGMSLVTPDFRFFSVNPAWIAMTGYPEDELLRMSFKDITHPDHLSEDTVHMRELAAGTIPVYSTEKRYIRKDGSILQGLLTVTAIRDEQGTLRYFGAQVEDITRRNVADEALRESEKKFRSLVEYALEGILLLDLQGNILFANNATARMIEVDGYAALAGRNVMEFIAPESREAVLRDFAAVAQGHDAYLAHYSVISAQGKKIFVESIGKIISYEGKPADFISLRDITEQKRAEDALRESEERFRTILNSTQSGIVVIDPNTHTILEANPKALEMIGCTAASVTGSVCHQFICPAESGKCPVTDLGQTIDSSERVLLTLEGERKPILKSVIKTILGGKEVLIESFVDITERKQTEQLLQESEEKFRSLVEFSLEGIFILDFEGKILFTNHAAARTVEVENRADVIGRNVMEFIAPESRPDVIRDFMQVAQGHDAYLARYNAISAQGKKICIESIGKIINYERKPADLISIRDITERVQAELALKESEQKHRILLDESSDPIFSFYPDGTYRYVNRAFAEGVGKAVGQIIGKKIEDVFPKDEAEKRFSVLRTVFATGNGHEFEVRVPRPDGDRYYITTIVPVKDTEGSVISAICSSKDITARKRVEEALQQSEEKYRHMIENSHDVIYTMTPNGIFTFVSPSWTVLLGHPVNEVVGKAFQQFVHPEDIPRCQVFLEKTIEGARQPDVEYRVLHMDGSWRWHNSKSVPLHDETGTIIGFEGIASDITDRKRMEEALWQANKKLNLLSGITRHDIKNQLFALNGFVELLHRKALPPGLEAYFTRITKTSERIAAMIEFTREYEKIGVTVPAWHDCRTLIDTTTAQAPLGRVVVKNEIPAGTEIFVDPLIAKVFYNLMDNAARYGGKITAIRFTMQERDGNWILAGEDDGDGIPADEKERIFNRGFGKNTGLGLALSREILDITGITIRENGEPGKGARFEIIVPKDRVRFT